MALDTTIQILDVVNTVAPLVPVAGTYMQGACGVAKMICTIAKVRIALFPPNKFSARAKDANEAKKELIQFADYATNTLANVVEILKSADQSKLHEYKRWVEGITTCVFWASE